MNPGRCQSLPAEEKPAESRVQRAMAAGRMGIWEFQPNPVSDMPSAPGAGSSPQNATARAEILSPKFGARLPEVGAKGGRIILSEELQSLLGLPAGQFTGSLDDVLGRILPAHRLVVLKAFSKALRDGTEAEVEIEYSRPGRAPGWLMVRGCPQEELLGHAQGLLGVAVEITERKLAESQRTRAGAELEQQLAAQTKQLKATTQELDAFCYSVSHDLRAPLRSIRGFNEVLIERYAAKLDDRGREFLRRACESSNAMEQLIFDLLKLSRAGRAELAPAALDLSKLAGLAAEWLRASAPERRGTFHIAPALQAVGDERLIRIVLENLLGNAWKFTAKRPEALIEFNFSPPAEAFFVRDNGAGFDPAYKDRLFGVFQRLHTESEFSGTGVGLAIVKRIVSRHGGRVWAEGAPGGGATFYFSLPNNERI